MFPDWTKQALCAQIDPAIYFPQKGQGGISKAKNLCNTVCPVRQECLDWALSFEADNPTQVHGVFGGKSAREREVLLGRRSA